MTLTLALCVGPAIVVPAVITSAALTLEPLYFCVLVLVYMFVASRIISMFGEKLASGASATFAPATVRHGSRRDAEKARILQAREEKEKE
jgi:hypothetical protein